MTGPPEESIGVEIGAGELNVAVLRDGLPFTVAHRQLPEGTLHHGRLVNRAALAGTLKALWSENGFTGRNIRMTVPDPELLVRAVSFIDPGDHDALLEMLRLHGDKWFPELEMSKTALQADVVERDGQRVSLTVSAAPNETVNGFRDAAKAAGLKVAALESPMVAVARVLHHDLRESSLMVDIGMDITHIGLVAEGAVRHSATGQFGARDFYAAVSALGYSDADAMRLVRAFGVGAGTTPPGFRGDPSAIQNATLEASDHFVTQLDGALNSIRITGRGYTDNMLAVGEGALINRLPGAISSYLPTVGTPSDLRLSNEMFGVEDPERYAVAMGCAAGTGAGLVPAPRQQSAAKRRVALSREITNLEAKKGKKTRSIPKPYLFAIGASTLLIAAMALLSQQVSQDADRVVSEANAMELAQASTTNVAQDAALRAAAKELTDISDLVRTASGLENARNVSRSGNGILIEFKGSASNAALDLTREGRYAVNPVAGNRIVITHNVNTDRSQQ